MRDDFCIKFALAISKLVYGVMVTQLFLVQSFKVRVLVDQQKASQEIERLFYWLQFKCFVKVFNGEGFVIENICVLNNEPFFINKTAFFRF